VQRKKRTARIEQILMEQQRQQRAHEEAVRLESQNKDKKKTTVGPGAAQKRFQSALTKLFPKEMPKDSGRDVVQTRRYEAMVVNREYFLERDTDQNQAHFQYRKKEKSNDIQSRLSILAAMRKNDGDQVDVDEFMHKRVDETEDDESTGMGYNTQRTKYQYFEINQKVTTKSDYIPERCDEYSSDDSDDLVDVDDIKVQTQAKNATKKKNAL
jgi:hypothetical protein